MVPQRSMARTAMGTVPCVKRVPGPQHPNENAFNWLAHQHLDRALAAAAREHAHGRLVDIGCGLKPYAETFAPYVTEHVGVDHPDSPHALTSVDILATAYDVPVDSAAFDTALLSEVLEHLEEPLAALRECSRLLAPGGKVIVTAPFVWVLHEEPRDYYRYSPHSLRWLLQQAGFVDIQVRPLSGQWGTIALLSGYALRRSPAWRLGRVLDVVVHRSHMIAEWLDQRRPEPWLSWNHLVVATKPSD
jgi:SAM-dependent methyltransferase